MQTIASLEIGQIKEILARLEKEQIPAEVRKASQEGGLEMSEILVEDDFYERACDVVDAWDTERLKAERKSSPVYCKKCGSRDYDGKWDEEIGYIYTCKNCGDEFAW